MLIALFTALYLFLGGTALDTPFTDIEEPLEHSLPESDRRSEILHLSEDLSKRLKDSQKDLEREIEGLTDVMRDYGAKPADFAASAERVEQVLARRQEAVLETRRKMKALMTEDEWNAVLGG